MQPWIEAYGRKSRPGLKALQAYWPEQVTALFMAFAGHLDSACGVHSAPAVYTAHNGWTFQFGHNACYLITGITVMPDAFCVGGIRVQDEASLTEALAYVDALYADGFAQRLAEHSAAKNARQIEMTRRRKEREAAEVAAMNERIVPGKFNQYRWMPKVKRRQLQQLYESDAQGMQDEALADDIGITLYLRCLQGQEEMALINAGRLKCHGCEAVLPYERGLMECGCGRQYLFREYMRSFRKNNMPSGAAADIFAGFIRDWPSAVGYAQKMRLIDNLVHEFHINLVTGVKGRFVGVNLIEGTKPQIAELILSLASADWNEDTKASFAKYLKG